MEMKVQIISIETIKPSSPTPQHLRNHKLSLLDQLAPPVYVPILLFYSACEINLGTTPDLLKSSLSKALTHFYPFAGRVKDGYTIDCNDDGATFIEARVDSDLSTVLKEPQIDLLQQLLPCDPLEKSPAEPSSQVLLAVQFNYFACGGMTISACIRHVVVDASTAASFLKIWAAIATGSDVVHDSVVYDYTSLFPPQDLSGSGIEEQFNLVLLPEVVTKRFVFDGSKIAALRNEIGSGLCSCRPTRFDAVSSLIWSAVIAGATKQSDPEISMHVAFTTPVNLRKRMSPPLPPLCMGNVYHVTTSNSFMANSTSCNKLVEKIHESIMKIDDKHVRQIYGSGSCLNILRNMLTESGRSSNTRVFANSSWCRFPFYETDFGWGKPIWLTTALRLNGTAILLDTSDGEGIEALISLTKEEIEKLEQDPEILAYASLNPSII